MKEVEIGLKQGARIMKNFFHRIMCEILRFKLRHYRKKQMFHEMLYTEGKLIQYKILYKID